MKITTVFIGILVMLIVNNGVHCILVIKPSDAAVKIGDFVIMRCSSSFVSDTCGQIAWKHFEPKSDTGEYIYSDYKLIQAVTSYIFINDSRAGNCHLRINATPSAAGRYECFDGTSEEASAALIVLENVPEVSIINQSHSNVVAALECSVKYYGDRAPNVQWVKIVGNSWTDVTATESVVIKNPVLRLTQFSSLIKIPTDNATEHFICNVTILTYAWKALICGAELNKHTEGENPASLAEAYIDGRSHGIGIGVAICLCLCGIIFLIVILKRKLQKR